MWLFRKETDEEKQEKARQQEAVDALNRGEIPPIAKERILHENARGKNFFSSDLTTREYLLVREAGIQTVGQVMGTAFYKVGFWGFFNRYRNSTGEVPEVTRALTNARLAAVERMRQEAELMGASGVIGVRINMRRHQWADNLTEFTAFGTAVRLPNWKPGTPVFTSTLNGQEFWQLYRAGYMPHGIVMGACAYYLHMDWNTRRAIYGWFSPNQELPTFTDGYRTAARLADLRLQSDLAEHGASGAVDVIIDPGEETIEYEINDTSYYDILLNYVILGTAVSAHPEMEQKHSAPLLCLNLASKTFGRLGSTNDTDWEYYDKFYDGE